MLFSERSETQQDEDVQDITAAENLKSYDS
jgi:hypothetical protein